MMKKRSFIFWLLFIFFLGTVVGQDDKCSKPRVAVVLDETQGDSNMTFFEFLNSHYSSQPKELWLKQIQDWTIDELKQNSPDVVFVPASGKVPDDCEYYFRYILSFTGAGNTTVNPVTGLEQSEYTAFLMTSKLASNPICGIQGRILDVNITEDDRDLFATIQKNIAAYGKIGKVIEEHESTHLVPPRGIGMEVSKNKDYVSPLQENRSLNIKIDVTNCKDQKVYDREHGQLVFLPRHTDRGENEPTKGFPQNQIITDNLVTLIIVRPKGASDTYTLKKGINADMESIKIMSCGLDDKVLKEINIPVHGLEIKVKPNRRQIYQKERTDIEISFNEISPKDDNQPNGKSEPVPNRKLDVKITGLVDGKVSPIDDYITDDNGKVWLTYRAGKKDKRITITASYQPVDYPDKAEGSSSITVNAQDKKFRWYGNLTAQLYENSKCSKNVLKDITFQKVNLNIWAQHIDIYVPNNIVDNSDNIKVTGSVFGKVDYSYYMEGGDENHNKIEINQARGMHVFPITYENVQNILIISEKLADENAMKQMEEMAKKMASGNYSIEEMENIATQMGNRMSDDRKSFPVRVIIQLTGNWRGDKLVYEYVHETDNGKVVEEREIKDIIEADLAMPITLELKGTCTKSDNGEINIHAEMHKLNNGPPCERSTANATFTLKRHVVKK